MAFWESKPQPQEQKIIQQPGKMMLLETKLKYIPMHLYYTKPNENGFICLWQTPMQHKGSRRKIQKEPETSPLLNSKTVNQNTI